MKTIPELQKGIDLLTEKYCVSKAKLSCDGKTVAVDGKEFPLLPWRAERRFNELKNLVASKQINGISTMRTLRIEKQGADLLDVFYREADICRYILGTEIVDVFAIANGDKALNVIAGTKDGYVCTFELYASLHENEKNIDKHEIIAVNGVACDRVVDTQVPQASIYVFSGKPEADAYTDVDAELYGFEIEECAVIRSAFDIAKNGTSLECEASRLSEIRNAVERSLKDVENVVVNG